MPKLDKRALYYASLAVWTRRQKEGLARYRQIADKAYKAYRAADAKHEAAHKRRIAKLGITVDDYGDVVFGD